MPYATQQDLVDRFGQQELIELSDRARSGAIDPAVVAKALADADAEIDGYLSAKFALPLSAVPSVINRIACDVTRYYLYDDRVSEAVRKRYEDAVKFLKGVVAGEISIGVDASSESPSVSGGPQTSSPDREFTRETLADY
jgi:phage gp36-like protein